VRHPAWASLIAVALAVSAHVLVAQNEARSGRPAGSGLIYGRVVDAKNGTPLDQAVVALHEGASLGGPVADQVRVNGGGYFVFSHVRSGTWTVGAASPGYAGSTSSGKPVPIVLSEGETASNVVIRLVKFGAIGGRVLDDLGDPVVGVVAQALEKSRNGRWQVAGRAVTDDRGVYRLSHLYPGQYVVVVPSVVASVPLPPDAAADHATASETGFKALGVTGSNWSESSVALNGALITLARLSKAPNTAGASGLMIYPTVFAPDSLEPSGAKTISLAHGQEAESIDIRLGAVPAFSVSGQVAVPNGFSIANTVLHLVPNTGSTSDPDVAVTVPAADGHFVFPCVPSGQYVITALVTPSSAAVSAARMNVDTGSEVVSAPSTTLAVRSDAFTLWMSTPVSVDRVNVSGILATLSRGFRISGHLEFEGTSRRPTVDELSRAPMLLRSMDGQEPYLPTRVDPQAPFQTPEFPPGRYIVNFNPPMPWRVKSALLNGKDVADEPVEIMNTSIDGLAVVLSDHLPGVSGVVHDADGKPFSHATVVAFTAERALWRDSRSRRLRSSSTTPTGTFSIGGLPPGDYFLAALSDDIDENWNEPDRLLQLSRVAVTLHLFEGQSAGRDLRVITRFPGGALSIGSARDLKRPVSMGDDITLSGPYVIESDPHASASTVQRDAAKAAPDANSSLVASIVDDQTSQPVRGAMVVLRSLTGGIRTGLTDEFGRLAFTNLEPGRYHLSATKAAYLRTEFGAKRPSRPGTSLLVAEGSPTLASVRLTRGSVVAGIVMDSLGRPIAGAHVRILTIRNRGGETTLASASGATPEDAETDDRGQYRVYGLTAGEYLIAATPGSTAGLAGTVTTDADVAAARQRQQVGVSGNSLMEDPAGAGAAMKAAEAYSPTFFPGVREIAGAAIVKLGPSEEHLGVDFPLALTPSLKLSGVVATASGASPSAARVTIFPAGAYVPGVQALLGASGSGSAASLGGITSVATSSQGAFSISGLAPGTYTILAQGAPRGARDFSLWSSSSVQINDRDVSGFAVSLQAGLSVSGRVVVEDGKPTPSGLRIALTGAIPGQPGVAPAPVTVSADNEFVISGLAPGRYRLVVNGLPSPWIMKSAQLGSTDMADSAADLVSAAEQPQMQIALTDRSSELYGVFSDAAGQPATDYFVIAFPADREWWIVDSRRIRAARPAVDGHFSFTSLPAGSYRLAAVTDVEPGEWFDAAFLDSILPGSIAVTLGEGERKQTDLRIASRW